MGKCFKHGRFNLPEHGCKFFPLPYYLLGDETFPLKLWLLRPYPGKNLTEEQYVYIYRHARARRVTENTFVILIAR